MSELSKSEILIGGAVIAAVLGFGGIANWLIQTAVMSEVRPLLFVADLYAFAASLPSPLDTIAVLLVTGVILAVGVGVIGIIAGAYGFVHDILS